MKRIYQILRPVFSTKRTHFALCIFFSFQLKLSILYVIYIDLNIFPVYSILCDERLISTIFHEVKKHFWFDARYYFCRPFSSFVLFPAIFSLTHSLSHERRLVRLLQCKQMNEQTNKCTNNFRWYFLLALFLSFSFSHHVVFLISRHKILLFYFQFLSLSYSVQMEPMQLISILHSLPRKYINSYYIQKIFHVFMRFIWQNRKSITRSSQKC